MVLPTENNTDMFDQANINLAIEQFNFTCETFTTVMAIKHQMLYSLFNGTYYYFNDSTEIHVKVTSDEGIRNLTLMIEYLETLANILQDMEVCTY